MTLAWEPDEEDLAFWRVYGPWEPLDLAGVTGLLEGLGAPWWVVGGQAIEAFSGVARAHEDLDISFFPSAFQAVREQVRGRYDLWSNNGGTFRVVSDASPEPLDPLAQVWLREHALAPWVLDAIPTPQVDGRWQSRRHDWFTAELDEVTWVDDSTGIRFLAPEVVLLFKAGRQHPKDEIDLRSALPRMTSKQRELLRERITRAHPRHGWLAVI
ncbi:MAG: hypothetical protein ABI890_08355 [Lapillicoccus sp.]